MVVCKRIERSDVLRHINLCFDLKYCLQALAARGKAISSQPTQQEFQFNSALEEGEAGANGSSMVLSISFSLLVLLAWGTLSLATESLSLSMVMTEGEPFSLRSLLLCLLLFFLCFFFFLW